MNNEIKHNIFNIFQLNLFVIIILLRLPPFYILFFQNSLLISHNIARGFLIINTILLILSPKSINKDGKKIHTAYFALLMLFFIVQSLSVFNAVNIVSFLREYKDVLFSLLLFINAFFYVNRTTIYKILTLLIVTGLILSIYQFFLYFFPNIIFTYLKNFFYDPYWLFVQYQVNRGRYFSDIFNEFLIPLMIYIFTVNRSFIPKIFSIALPATIIFYSSISGWRTKFVTSIVSVCISLFYALVSKSIKLKTMVIFFSVLFFAFFLGDTISLYVTGSNTLDRILKPTTIDIGNITGRFDYWKESFSLMMSSPLVGFGLGNYYDISTEVKSTPIIPQPISPIENPHNIFSSVAVSSGMLGLLIFCIIIGYNFKKDLTFFKRGETYYPYLIIGFWVLFIHALGNPHEFFTYLSLFWLLRGSIEGLTSSRTSKS